jgi:hypothetical protein
MGFWNYIKLGQDGIQLQSFVKISECYSFYNV